MAFERYFIVESRQFKKKLREACHNLSQCLVTSTLRPNLAMQILAPLISKSVLLTLLKFVQHDINTFNVTVMNCTHIISYGI